MTLVFRNRIRIRRIRMFLGLPDPHPRHPDPVERGTDPRIRISISTRSRALQYFRRANFCKVSRYRYHSYGSCLRYLVVWRSWYGRAACSHQRWPAAPDWIPAPDQPVILYLAKCGWDIAECGWDLAVWMRSGRVWMWSSRVVISSVKVATVLGSIPASSDTVESEGKQMKRSSVE